MSCAFKLKLKNILCFFFWCTLRLLYVQLKISMSSSVQCSCAKPAANDLHPFFIHPLTHSQSLILNVYINSSAMTTPELTLIVAATRSMGIGFQGTMPWKGLKKEMQYFARVTTRVPASSQVREEKSISIQARHTNRFK
jgi:hypothetical protein